MKRAVVTGASGFVGANLARRLLRDGHEVHLLLRRGFAPWRVESIRDDVRLHEVDLGDRNGLLRALGAIRPDWVFHLAVHGAYSSQTDVQEMTRTNVVGTVNLVEACLKSGFEAFVNTGSSSEYGFKDRAPCESEPLEPNSYYAVTKASTTLYCRFVARSQGVRLPTMRLYSAFGPYEEPSRLIPTLIVRGLHDELPPLVDPEIARDYVYVDDVVEAYLLAASLPQEEAGAVYNVGTGVQTTLREVVEVARRVMAIEAEPVWSSMPNRSWDTSSWVSDSRKIRRILGWQPRYSFEDGFRAMVEWLTQDRQLLAFYQHIAV